MEYCTCILVLYVLIVLVDSCSVLQSKKMEKLLAALNLPQVGEIRLVDVDDESYEEENDGSLFTIELNDRVYTMKVSGKRLNTIPAMIRLRTVVVDWLPSKWLIVWLSFERRLSLFGYGIHMLVPGWKRFIEQRVFYIW